MPVIDYDAWARTYDDTRAVQQIRRDCESGRIQQVMAEFQPLVEKYGDGFVFTARP